MPNKLDIFGSDGFIDANAYGEKQVGDLLLNAQLRAILDSYGRSSAISPSVGIEYGPLKASISRTYARNAPQMDNTLIGFIKRLNQANVYGDMINYGDGGRELRLSGETPLGDGTFGADVSRYSRSGMRPQLNAGVRYNLPF